MINVLDRVERCASSLSTVRHAIPILFRCVFVVGDRTLSYERNDTMKIEKTEARMWCSRRLNYGTHEYSTIELAKENESRRINNERRADFPLYCSLNGVNNRNCEMV